jgi:cytidylate kinase
MPLITITTRFGSGDPDIATEVSDALGIKRYDDHELKKAAFKMGIRSEDLRSLDEKSPGFFERMISRRPELYLDFMEAVVYDAAVRGEGVIVGHGSQFLLRNFGCALHVYIHASEAARIRNLMKQQGLNREAAEKLIRRNDDTQMGFFRYAYNLQLDDPSLYDLVINTEKLGTDAAVELIVNTARSEEIKTCSLEAVDALARLSDGKKLRAALIENDINVSMLHIEIPQKGHAVVRGFTYTWEERDRIVAALKKMPEFAEVKTDISVMPSAGD